MPHGLELSTIFNYNTSTPNPHFNIDPTAVEPTDLILQEFGYKVPSNRVRVKVRIRVKP